MPVAVTEPPYRSAPPEPPRKLWTRAECAVLEAAGLLDQEHLELVEGELINKMGKKRPHVNGATLVMGWLTQVFGMEFVNLEASIDVAPEDHPTNEPQPDLIVLKRPSWEYTSNPGPSDLRLVVEVSDSSLDFDMTTKAGLYARAGISEYWILDVSNRRLIVHRAPGAGQYTSVVAYSDQESIAPLAAPYAEFPVAGAFRT